MKNKFHISIKKKKKLHSWLRAFIQMMFFCFIPSAYTAAFAGVKYIFTQLGAGEKIEITSFVAVLLILCLFTVVFGRFFCGYACAFGSLGDGVHALYVRICKKLKKKPIQIETQLAEKLSALKYVVLTIIVVMCFLGVYSKTQGISPWDVFSMLHAGNLKLTNYMPGFVILVLILAGMSFQERFFCRFLCPMGAIFSLLPVIPAFALHRDRESCIKNCSACTRKCPSDIALPNDGSSIIKGDCFNCQKCISTCPKSNIHCGIQRLSGNEIWFTILRVLILVGLLVWQGV